MKRISLIAMCATALLSASPVMAQEIVDRPVVPTDAAGWAGAMVIIVGAMFLMAAVIGPAVRAEMVEEPAPAHDDHGDDHGHGHDDAHGRGH